MKPKVTKKDLIGDLENFPIVIVEKMLEYQYKQTGRIDIKVFQDNRAASKEGFCWEDTIEGYYFWNAVIKKRFDVFFKRYPERHSVDSKLSKNVYIRGDDKLYENVIKTLERRGGVNTEALLGNSGVYYIDPKTNHIRRCTQNDEKLYNIITSTFEKIEPDNFIIEMTLSEIAEKLGIDVELLRIKK